MRALYETVLTANPRVKISKRYQIAVLIATSVDFMQQEIVEVLSVQPSRISRASRREK
jgi:hypothetical protein